MGYIMNLKNINCVNSPEIQKYKCPCDNLPLDKYFAKGGKTKKRKHKGGNCLKPISDCFGKNQQLGISPSCGKVAAELSQISEKAFFNRYTQHGGNTATPYLKTTIGKLFKTNSSLKNITIHSFNNNFYTEGFTGTDSYKKIEQLKQLLIKNGINKKNIRIGDYSTGGTSLRYTKKGGGEGYYLAVEKCPIAGLAE